MACITYTDKPLQEKNYEIIEIDGYSYKVISRETTEDIIARHPHYGAAMQKNNWVAKLIIQKPRGKNIYMAYEGNHKGKTFYKFIG